MRLQSLRLHPFGRHADQAHDLAKPLIVIHGPNEMGKTTLRQAILHVLFTPTNLTPTQLRKTVQPWLPLPGGDHAAVTLVFTHGGATWTLEKRWGAGQASRLGDGTTAIADPAAVQARLGEMLVHGEATFRHVLFTGQAELERTLEAIAANTAALADIRDLLSAGAGAAADVDEQRLRRTLDERIAKAFGRWNDGLGRPERQGGQEKGLANRWINGVGTILKAWYAWQELAAEHEQVLALERDIDGVTREAAELEGRIATAAAFLQRHGHLRASLNERRLLDERQAHVERLAASLTAAYRAWPVADAALGEWTRRKAELEAGRDLLQAELKHATQRLEGAAMRDAFTRLVAARLAWQQANDAAASLPDPGSARVEAVRRLQAAITAAELALAARTLSWRIEASASTEVTITRGDAPAETMTADGAGLTGSAEARVRIAAGGISVTVESGSDDVDAVFAALAADRQRLAVELAACAARTPADVRLMADRRRDAEARAREAKAGYAGALGDMSFEQWEEAITALDELPGTRAIPTIETELETVRTRLAEGRSEADHRQRSIEEWKRAYATLDALEERLLDTKRAFQEAREKLASLPTLPEEFDSPQTLLAKLDEAQNSQLVAQQQLTEKKAACAELTTRLGERRGQDVAEQAEAAERHFTRARSEGRDYLRIREELERVTAHAGADPLAGFAGTVTDIFARITGAAAAVQFDGQLPSQVMRGAIALTPDRLSHGGGGALALALRLAMADAYLAAGDGFIMLDDPLVHFDETRMGIAADILRAVSARTQVLFFTCHDHHAARLTAGARVPG